jgi:hypothetical protein
MDFSDSNQLNVIRVSAGIISTRFKSFKYMSIMPVYSKHDGFFRLESAQCDSGLGSNHLNVIRVL